MPELDWSFGYPMAIGVMLASAILPYLYFKKRGWF
jgi:magnesium transporter